MAETHTPLLDLHTLTERPFVRIDDQAYTLKPVSSFSVSEYLTFPKRAARIATLANAAEISGTDDPELSSLVDQVCRVILEAPAEVHEKLTDAQRLELCLVFSGLRRGEPSTHRRTTEGGRRAARKQKTGANRRPVSPASTAEPR